MAKILQLNEKEIHRMEGNERRMWSCAERVGRYFAIHSHRATEREVMRQMQERALYRQVNECVYVCVLLYGGAKQLLSGAST